MENPDSSKISKNDKFKDLQTELIKITSDLKNEEERNLELQAFKSTVYDFLGVFYNIEEKIPLSDSNEQLKSHILKKIGREDPITSETDGIKALRSSKLEKSATKKDFLAHPIIFDSQKEIFVLMNLGMAPTADQRDFYNKDFIYPINYRIERIYKNYMNNTNNLLIYTCMIKNKENKIIFEIYDSDKLLCSGGKSCWKTFKELTKMIYSDIQLEDFFALSNKKILSMIEKKTDMKALRGYIPLDYRQN